MTAAYLVLLRRVARPAVALAVCATAGLFLALGALVRAEDGGDRLLRGLSLVEDLGLSLLVPFVALVASRMTFGRWVDEGSAVLLWATPVPRYRLVLAAWAAAFTIVAAAAVLPLTVAASVAGLPGLTAAALTAATFTAVAYTALFCWSSVHGGQALLWGVAYVLVWEGFVARASAAAALLSVRSHGTSLVEQQLRIGLDNAVLSAGTARGALVAVAVVGLALAWRGIARGGFATA